MKRKNPDLKPFDRSSLDLVWAAIYEARCGNLTFLDQLLENSHFCENLDWNHSTRDEKHPRQGISLAWAASQLAHEGIPTLLNALIKSPDNFVSIDWNARPLNTEHIFCGASVAWMAAYLAYCGKPFLLERLLHLPTQILLRINWELTPVNQKFPFRDIPIIGLAALLGLQDNYTLLNKLMTLVDFTKINWNFLVSDAKNPYYGVSLPWMAAELAEKEYSNLLEKLLTLPTSVFLGMNWNAQLLHTGNIQFGVSLAWKAARLALLKKPSLLTRMLELPNEGLGLAQIDWDSRPQNTNNTLYGVSLACLAADLALDEKQAGLFNRLAELPNTVLARINWNFGPLHAANERVGSTVAWKTAFIAFHPRSKNSALLLKLVTLPKQILIKIDWNAKPVTKANSLYNVSLAFLAAMSTLQGNPILLNKLLELAPEILPQLNWNLCPLHKTSSYQGITLAMMAALLAHYKNFTLLEELVKLPNGIFVQMDWSAKALNPKTPGYGSSLAWNAALLALYGKPALLNKLITLSGDILDRIDWNCSPLDPTHLYHGASLACLAVDLFHQDEKDEKKAGFLNKLALLPDKILNELDWNSCPQNPKNYNYGVTLAWKTAFGIRSTRANSLLDRLARLPDPVLIRINWAASPLNKTHPFYGASLAWITILFSVPVVHALLYRLEKILNAVSHQLDWNSSCPESEIYHGASVAWLSIWIAERGVRGLLKKLTESSDSVLREINWNSSPQHPHNVFLNESVVSMAVRQVFLRQDDSFLNRLLKLPNEILTTINWNLSPEIKFDPDYGRTIAMKATRLAHQGKPALLNKLITTPEIAEKINWNLSPDISGIPSVISSIFVLIKDSIIHNEDKIIENLITDKIVLNFSWTLEALRNLFYSVFNKYSTQHKTFLKCDLALAQLSLEILQTLKTYFENPQYQNLLDFLGFLIGLKGQSPEKLAESKTLSNEHPVRASTGYWMMANLQLSSASRIDYLKKIVPEHPLYIDSLHILARLHQYDSLETKAIESKEIEPEDAKKSRLNRAFEFACLWTHHNKTATHVEKEIFIISIVAEICRMADGSSVIYEDSMYAQITTLVLHLQHCQDLEVPYLTKRFIQDIEISRLQKQLKTVKDQWHSLKSSKPDTIVKAPEFQV
jgi:hypothetical protein